MGLSVSKILVVDDDPLSRLKITSFFEEHTVKAVWEAADGTAAISILNEHDDIDLIVSELHMPETDGIEFIEHLHTIDCQTPFLIVSSADSNMLRAAQVLANAKNLNLIAALSKPLNVEELERILRNLGN